MAFSKSPPTNHDDVRICQGETPLTASRETLGGRKIWIFLLLLLCHLKPSLATVSIQYHSICWYLEESEVSPVGAKFISQELTRQGPVVDHCVPGAGLRL